MQPPQERCGVCGARLGPTGDSISLGEIARLSAVIALLLGGFVVLAVGLLSAVFWLLR